MNTCLLIAFSFLISTSCIAQENDRLVFDAYCGLPNTSNYFLYRDQTIDTVANSDYRVIGTPVSIGIRSESFLTDSRVSIGGEINYCLAGYRFNYWDSTQLNAPTYTYSYKSSQLRIILRGAYHFVQNELIDVYAVAGIGYRYIYRSHSSSDPNFQELESENTFPWTGRLGLGFRIFPIPNVGICGEAGIFGGSLIQVGLSFRI